MLNVVIPSMENPCADRLRHLGFHVQTRADSRVAALDEVNANEVWFIPDTVFHGADWNRIRVELGRAPRSFVVGIAKLDTRELVAAMRDGAFDVVSESDADARWSQAVEAAAASQQLWVRLYAGRVAGSESRLVGRSRWIEEIRRDLDRLGPTDVTVLLQGESGVGKERVAVALHEAGRPGPLVTLNCAAMPRELIEAELFGAEKGAYTGAVRARPGLVEQSHQGTLFLDEVGELDLALQPKLLRFIETRRARRVGGEAEYRVELRVVAATNRNLELAVSEGRFRADLYYRLAEVVVRVPPLRERKEDIPMLVHTFVGAASERFGKHFDSVEPGLLLRFEEYPWPGNVRELKSVVDRLVLFHDGPVLRTGWWEPPLATWQPDHHPEPVRGPEQAVIAGVGAGRTARMDLARRLLAEGRLSLSEIAARAGVHPTTLFRWRKSGKTRPGAEGQQVSRAAQRGGAGGEGIQQ
jgi:DNA-binding NtrC family response regulator